MVQFCPFSFDTKFIFAHFNLAVYSLSHLGFLPFLNAIEKRQMKVTILTEIYLLLLKRDMIGPFAHVASEGDNNAG